MLNRQSIRLRRLARRVLATGSEPERAARGLAAGCFAAAFPLPGLQIPFSVFLAWLIGGNKGIAVMPQFLSNAGTMLPLAWLQYWIGSKLWPGTPADPTVALTGLKSAVETWSWKSPLTSLDDLFGSLLGLGADVIGPLLLGVVVTAIALSMLAYPTGLIAFTWYQHRRTTTRERKGIGPRPVMPLMLPSHSDDHLTIEQAAARYAIRRVPLVKADGVRLLVDGAQAFPEMLGCIAAARTSIDLETYILCADYTGKRFGAALMAAARRGVAVRLLYDGFGGIGLPQDYIDALLSAGVKVRVYRPLSTIWKRGFRPLNRRDHRKILVIDRSVGFAGGLNIADDYASKEDFGTGWRDTHLRIDGSVPVQELAKLFNDTWVRADEYTLPAGTEAPAPAPESELPPPAACTTQYTSRDVTVQILSNKEFFQRVRLRRAYLHAIRNARHYILIENAYFIPDRGIRRALYRAVRRGVVVGVIIAKESDVRIAAMASRALYAELLTNGVRIFEYPTSMVHSKCAAIDDIWSMVSSYNLDHRSLLHNLEAGVLLLNRPVAHALRDQLMIDITRSREVLLEQHQSRSWREALLEGLAYQLRYWL
ncbi:MAG TPA: DUF2062 domain-containing protein [Planctomycetota bacterium]|nr:DUF2062 domain-containing protein [Planctomycetota bacterium]